MGTAQSSEHVGGKIPDAVSALLTVNIPVYNEAATISALIQRVVAAPYEKQIIVVNDGSTDDTGEVLRSWADPSTGLRTGRNDILVVTHPTNRGKSRAIRTGLEAASHVKVSGTRTTYNKDGAPLIVVELEETRDGDSVLQRATCVQSSKPTWPAGSINVDGGNAQEYFQLEKAKGASGYKVLTLGPRTQLEPSLRMSMPSLVSAYYTQNGPVPTASSPDGSIKIVSANAMQLDGHDVVEVNVEAARGGMRSERRYFFEPHTWALAGWSQSMGGMSFEGRVTYQPGSNPPKISSLDEWLQNPKRPDAKQQRRQWTFTSVEFGHAPAEQFTLAAYGIGKPGVQALAKVQAPTPRRRWMVATSVVLLALIALCFDYAARRGRRQSDGRTSNSIP